MNKIEKTKNLRPLDNKVEKIIRQFLDEHLYNNSKFENVKRTTNIEEQIKGIDIILSIPSLDIYNAKVDEKSASSYMMKQINTFCLELSFMNKSQSEMIGWFLNDELETEYYMCVYPQVKKEFIYKFFDGNIPNRMTNEDRIKLAENLTINDLDTKNILYFFINKKKLIFALENEGLSKSDIIKKTNDIRNIKYDASDKEIKYYKFNNEIDFVFSRGYTEQPINLKIKKSFYKRYAERFVEIKDGKAVFFK